MTAAARIKDSGVAWIGEIPASWEMRKISRSFSLISSGTTPSVADSTFYEEGTIPWVNTGDLNDDIVTKTAKKLTEQAVRAHSPLRIYSPGTLLVAMYGATIGKVGILGVKACTNQACCALSGPKHFDMRFIYFWFLDNRRNLIALSNGGGQPNINQDLVRSLRVQAPVVAEQQRISRYLDREMGKVDCLVALRRRQMQLLREQRAALIHQAVTVGLNRNAVLKDSGLSWLGQIPGHWQIKRLGTFATVKARLGWKGLKAEEYVSEGYIFLSTPNLKGDEIDFENVNYITKTRYDESPEISIREGDVLVAKDGATLGITALVRSLPAPATVNGSIAVLRPYRTCSGEFLALWFRSPAIQQFIDFMKSGMGVPHLFQSDLRRFPVVLPSEKEQREIVTFVETETSKLDRLISAYANQLDLLAEYRVALIHECVTGQRNVDEAFSLEELA
jgi:type I restriction enzyme S subunit